MTRLLDSFVAMLQHAVQSPGVVAAHISILGICGYEKVAKLSCGTLRLEYFDAPLFHEGFLQQATAHSKKPCMTFQGQTLSYAEVEARATALARLLMAQGVGPNTAVGLMLDRSHELVIALLAILLAGGAPSSTISLLAN